MKAEIITIGDEILIGQVIDTNSAFLATELNKLGIAVVQITSVSDKKDSISGALDGASTRAQLVLITGGLGPTSDDITKKTLADYFNTTLVINEQALEQIRLLLQPRGLAINDLNIKQAELPANSEMLINRSGTAQGMWFVKNNIQFISLPGVPYEMKGIFMDEIVPRLRQRFQLPAMKHITVLTHGVSESAMAKIIYNWESALPDNMKLAYLPSPGLLRLRLTGTAPKDMNTLSATMDEEMHKLKLLIAPHIYGYDEDTLEKVVGDLLIKNKLTVAVAESCTGGTIGSMITSVPGSSSYFKGGVIAYSNEIKTLMLNVNQNSLLRFGAVSREVCEEMATGVRNYFSTDMAVAVSGIAGPAGGSPEKPVGTTWIAVAGNNRVVSDVFKLGEHRGRNIQKAAVSALFMLMKEIEQMT